MTKELQKSNEQWAVASEGKEPPVLNSFMLEHDRAGEGNAGQSEGARTIFCRMEKAMRVGLQQWFFGLLVVVVFAGCSTKQTITWIKAPVAPLSVGKPMYVSVPEAKGRDEERTYEPSDFQTATASAGAFRKYGAVTMGRQPETQDKALASAEAASCFYLLQPTIRMWEDNPTEWSGEPDDLEIEIEIFAVASKASLARASLKGKSKWATFGDHPEDMLPGFIEPFAAEVFGDSSFKKKK